MPTDIDILAPDRFEELDTNLELIEAMLDDPDEFGGGDPAAFIEALNVALDAAAATGKQLTPADFDAAYTESEDDNVEENEGLGGLGN